MRLGDTALKILAHERLSVLLFHAVPRTTTDLVGDLTLASFERVVDFVSEHFNVVPLDDAVAGLQGGALPRRAACITFDDGYDTWLEGVVPALLKRNLHATFFITTGQFHQERMWHERVAHAIACYPHAQLDLPGLGLPKMPLRNLEDRKMALRVVEQLLKYQSLEVRDRLLLALEKVAKTDQQQLPRMTVDQMLALHAKGFGIGAHTVRHPILSLCEPAEAMREIAAVKDELEQRLRAEVRGFAYPNGRPGVDFTAEHVNMVRAAGYRYAVTTENGAADGHTPLFEIPRFTPWGPSGLKMAAQLARNLLTRPRYVTLPIGKVAVGKPMAKPSREQAPAPLVTFVENGAGFGGAIVALQTLLRSSGHTGFRYRVVTNIDVGDFDSISHVDQIHVIPDRAFNFRALARRIEAALGRGAVGKSLLFLVGRADDLLNRLPYFCRLAFHFLRERPAVIHGNNEPGSNREAMLVAKMLNIPYVQHVRGALTGNLRLALMRDGPQAFIPVSRWLTGELLVSGIPAERVRQIYDGVELAAAAMNPTDLRLELGLSAEVVLVAMVGMLVPWKGQGLFLDALAALKPTGQIVALIVGDTPERGDESYAISLQAQVTQLGLQDRVRFLGRRNDLQDLLPQINICVSASTSPEPLGLVMLEALAQGCLFVGPAFGAACEVIENGRTGFLFEPCSVTSLAQQLNEAIQHSDLPDKSYAQRGRAIIDAQFSGSRCAAMTSQIHHRLLQGI